MPLAGEATPETAAFKANVVACKGMAAPAMREARVLIAVAASCYRGPDLDTRISEKEMLRVEAKGSAAPMQDVLIAWIADVDHKGKAMRVDDQYVVAWAY